MTTTHYLISVVNEIDISASRMRGLRTKSPVVKIPLLRCVYTHTWKQTTVTSKTSFFLDDVVFVIRYLFVLFVTELLCRESLIVACSEWANYLDKLT